MDKKPNRVRSFDLMLLKSRISFMATILVSIIIAIAAQFFNQHLYVGYLVGVVSGILINRRWNSYSQLNTLHDEVERNTNVIKSKKTPYTT